MLIEEQRKLIADDTEDGQDVRIKRLFPSSQVRYYDPFVLFDEFFLQPPAAFLSHPHRGFEALTYLLEGGFRHHDTLGNDTTVLTGGVQHFTAGKGIEHSEMPGTTGMNHGIQLWVNLPQRLKSIDPDYHQYNAESIPVHEDNEAVIRTVAGAGSPVKTHSPLQYFDIIIRTKGTYFAKIPATHRGLAYVVSGLASIRDELYHPGQACPLTTGEHADIFGVSRARIILIAAEPQKEEMKLHGSFVD
jgi:redox-sensitive bicupin YhaK (pirin superfamily)